MSSTEPEPKKQKTASNETQELEADPEKNFKQRLDAIEKRFEKRFEELEKRLKK